MILRVPLVFFFLREGEEVKFALNRKFLPNVKKIRGGIIIIMIYVGQKCNIVYGIELIY